MVGDAMTALTIVALFGALLLLIGAVIGAEFQDRVHEAQRRRMAQRHDELRGELDLARSLLRLPWFTH